MQKILAAAALAAALGMSGGAYAADLTAGGSMKDAPAYIADTGWTGFYVGAGIGGGATNGDLKYSKTYPSDPGRNESAEANGLGGEGIFGTVEVGYDRQFGRFAGGVFFDYDFANITGDAAINGYKWNYGLNDSWSAGGRIGYLVNPSTLAYFLAAYTQANFSVPGGLGLENPTRDGITLGGGLETHLGGHWFLKGEYRITQLNTVTLFSQNFGSEECLHNVKLTDQGDIQSARLVLSYKADIFGGDVTPLK